MYKRQVSSLNEDEALVEELSPRQHEKYLRWRQAARAHLRSQERLRQLALQVESRSRLTYSNFPGSLVHLLRTSPDGSSPSSPSSLVNHDESDGAGAVI